MSQVFDEKGNEIPVTLIEAGPCETTQVKTKDQDGYDAIQVGFQKLKDRKIGKSKRKTPYRYVKEFSNGVEVVNHKIGDITDVSVFQEGAIVKIAGVSKGKGFAGAVKKWGFSGRPATHGTKHEERTVGSIGSSFPQRVVKGKKMPGRTGNVRITTKNLKIIKIDPKNNLLVIKGSVPGRSRTLLEIKG